MKPTFKAIEHKVDLALCLIAVLIALGFAFSNDAAAKSITDAESIGNVSKLEFDDQQKNVVVAKHKSKPSANTANVEIHRNIKSRNTNAMPVIDELNPAFKKSRLI